MKKKLFIVLLTSAMAASIAGTTLADERALSFGMNGDDVYALQSELYNLGYLYTAPDGVFGSDTNAALVSFQSDYGLEVDGVAGVSTNAVLFGTTNPLASTNAIKKGMSGDSVYNLQQRLYELGYLSESPDGVFGSKTEAALIAFQYANGLDADGVAGNMTNSILTSGYAIAGSSSSSSSGGIRYGSSGDEVYSIQNALYSLGYLSSEPTGYFGELTEYAVTCFQADYGLEVDGVVGANTLSMLGLSDNSSSSSYSGLSLAQVQEAIVSAAYNTASTSGGYCAEWISRVLSNAGLSYNMYSLRPSLLSYASESGLAYGYDTGFNANDYWAYVCYSDDLSTLQPGMIIATRSSYTYLGKQYGHVGIYVGNNTVLSSIGYIEELSLSEWISRYNNAEYGSTVRWGYAPF